MKKGKWDETKTYMVSLDPHIIKDINLIQTQNYSHIGLRGKWHNVKGKYQYYYPGLLDVLLHIEIQGNFFLPRPHAEILVDFLKRRNINSLSLECKCYHKDYFDEMKRKALLNYIKNTVNDKKATKLLNKEKWFINNSKSAIELLNDPELAQKTITKIWKIDWSSDCYITRYLMQYYNIIDNLKKYSNNITSKPNLIRLSY